MSKFKRWMILAIVSSALLLIVMDMTILYTALPSLTHDLGASASEKLWILNGYSLVMAGLLPAMGTLGDRLGYKKNLYPRFACICCCFAYCRLFSRALCISGISGSSCSRSVNDDARYLVNH